MKTGIQELPPKTAAAFADRARRMDGCVEVGTSGMYEFAQGSNVICLVMLDPPMGHLGKDARRADEIRAALRQIDFSKGKKP